jgi:hypothetical protein
MKATTGQMDTKNRIVEITHTSHGTLQQTQVPVVSSHGGRVLKHSLSCLATSVLVRYDEMVLTLSLASGLTVYTLSGQYT